MGYDNYECINCYCNGGENNPVKEYFNICMTCMDEITQEEQNNPRVTNSFSQWNNFCSNCVMCGKVNCFVFRAPMCESCSEQAIERGRKKCSNMSCMNSQGQFKGGSNCCKCRLWYCHNHARGHGECTACGIWYCEMCYESECDYKCNVTCMNCHNKI